MGNNTINRPVGSPSTFGPGGCTPPGHTTPADLPKEKKLSKLEAKLLAHKGDEIQREGAKDARKAEEKARKLEGEFDNYYEAAIADGVLTRAEQSTLQSLQLQTQEQMKRLEQADAKVKKGEAMKAAAADRRLSGEEQLEVKGYGDAEKAAKEEVKALQAQVKDAKKAAEELRKSEVKEEVSAIKDRTHLRDSAKAYDKAKDELGMFILKHGKNPSSPADQAELGRLQSNLNAAFNDLGAEKLKADFIKAGKAALWDGKVSVQEQQVLNSMLTKIQTMQREADSLRGLGVGSATQVGNTTQPVGGFTCNMGDPRALYGNSWGTVPYNYSFDPYAMQQFGLAQLPYYYSGSPLGYAQQVPGFVDPTGADRSSKGGGFWRGLRDMLVSGAAYGLGAGIAGTLFGGLYGGYGFGGSGYGMGMGYGGFGWGGFPFGGGYDFTRWY